uniref:Uncharacterized protein n=1 Tax=Solanum tuberosum TaxID=4113 RepID=M1DQL9_SOLTU
MSVNGSNTSQLGHNDDIGNLNDVNKVNLGGVGAIRLPPIIGNTVFNVTSTMLFFPPSRMMSLRDNIQSFKRLDGFPRPKVARKNQPPQKRARVIVINKEVAPSHKALEKIPPTRGKGKGKGPVQPTPAEERSDIIDVYDTHLTTFDSEDQS